MFYQFNEISAFKGNNLIKNYKHDAGYDIRSADSYHLMSGGSLIVSTGLHVLMPPGFKAIVQSRSGKSIKEGLECGNAGIIDAEYRGEILVKIYNHSDCPQIIAMGERFAQLMFEFSLTVPVVELQHIKIPQKIPEMKSMEYFSHITERGVNGFGSSGDL